MKKLILFSFLLLTVLCFVIIINTTNEAGITQQTGDRPFLLGAMNNQTDWNHDYISKPEYFGMNTWHMYIGNEYDSVMGRLVPTGWDYYQGHLDSLNADISVYRSVVCDTYLKKNAEHNMISLMQRPKIEWLCYGQRSDYQCEVKDSINPYMWFYSFQDNVGESISDNSQYGDGQCVLYCSQTFMSADTVLKMLRCNNQQTKDEVGWKYDKESTWFVKPSIRIDSAFANNPSNFSKLVCRVYVKDSDSNTIKEADIKVRNFKKDIYSVYRGNYLEEFYFLTPSWNDTSRLNDIQGAWGNAGAWSSRGNGTNDNKADIQVYWYGNCDMWIDYVRVDNDVADGLMNPNSPNFNTFNDWLKWEAQDIGGYSYQDFKSPYRFYIEELEFNNVPCISYVNKKLQEYSSQNPSGDTTDMMVCFWWPNFTNHLPFDHAVTNGYWKENTKFDTETLHEVFMDTTGLREFFTETYPFTGHDLEQTPFSKVPSTLPNTSGNCVLAVEVSPFVYEPWLQEQLDKDGYPNGPFGPGIWPDPGFFTWALKLANDYSKTYDKPFINMPQAHLWRNHDIEVRREPTNEELSMTTNLALSYGAKGIIYFWYSGSNDCSDSSFGKGFLDSGGGAGQVIRDSNAYHQNKWDSLISIHKRIRKWDSYFMSFDIANTNSYIYYKSSERNDLLTQTYFLFAKTFKPGSGTPICDPVDSIAINPFPDSQQSLTYDCQKDTYLQVALFDDDLVDYDKYFMIVNRRCSPYLYGTSADSNGGRRFVRILFDANHSAFDDYNNWSISNVESDSVYLKFDKTKIQNLDLGWFMPGEGKLYKIIPVIK